MRRIPLYPLIFEDNYHSAIWGGERIAKVFNRRNTPPLCAESWEISAHEASPSVVKNGDLRGRTLDSLTREYGLSLLGMKAPDSGKFPLLFKILDAQSRFSVQVHPSEKSAPLTGGEPKTEVWYVLGCDAPYAEIYAGFKPGVSVPDIHKAIENKCFEDLIIAHDVHEGEVIYIPGGLIHTSKGDALIYEVQQSSNTSYRFYDWDRTDADGKPRKLHIEECLKTVDFNLPPPRVRKEVRSPYFTLKPVDICGEIDFSANPESFIALFVANGSGGLFYDGGKISLSAGTSVLIPANIPVKVRGEARLLVTTL